MDPMPQYVRPSFEELENRWIRFQDLMAQKNLDGILFFQNADLIYLCGATQAEAVFLPREGPALILARPPMNRIETEAPWTVPKPMPRGTEFKKTLEAHAAGGLSRLGLELDVLPVEYYRRLVRKMLSGLDLVDASSLIRQIRAVKTDYELDMMHGAAGQLDAAFSVIPEVLSPGVTELELEGHIVFAARRQGHQGLIRVRGFNQEIFFGHVLSGPNGLLPAKIKSPTGGTGVGPGLGHGAGHRVIGPGELVSVDLCGTYSGYIVDMTRLYFTGPVPARVREAYEKLTGLIDELKTSMRPGAVCGELYDLSFSLAEKYGIAGGFMGMGDHRCPFIGHGIGLELDEWPVLARGVKMPLAAGMTSALEPRVFLPDVGVVGLEDTYHLTENGPEIITRTSRDITVVSF